MPENSHHESCPPEHSLFERAVTITAYLYLVRVPLLIGVLIFVVPFGALLHGSPLVPLLQNLFWLTSAKTFWFTITTLLLSWSLFFTWTLVLLNAERFGLPPISPEWVSKRSLSVVTVIAMPLLIAPFTQSQVFDYHRMDLISRAIATFFGFVAAYLVAFLAFWGAILLAPRGTQAVPAKRFPALAFMRNWLLWADDHDILPHWILQATQWVRNHLAPGLWIGYLNPKNGIPWDGHWLAMLFFLATSAVYFFIFTIGVNNRHFGKGTPVPALAFILVLLLTINWVFSYLSFLLDRYRIPLIVPTLIVCVGGIFPYSDHYYRVKPGVSLEPILPQQVLATRVAKNLPIVLIATAGGGIQAAVWTAQVLAGLEEQRSNWGGKSFAESIALISAVSGGAVGSMYYLNLFDPKGQNVFNREGLSKLTETASTSSLDEIGWALVYRDFPRVFFPLFTWSSDSRILDRGHMLEESWRKNGGVDANLSDWRIGVSAGLRPAVIFNSTIAETGEPLVFASTEIKGKGKGETFAIGTGEKKETFGRKSFYDLNPNSDILVVTAARLASTFPYVTPAARALSTNPEHHIVDGGYYDNYGVNSLISWLDEALTKLDLPAETLLPVLIIQIRSFPEESVPAPTNKGWFYQAYAPLNALVSVRTTGQLVRGDEGLKLFADKWNNTGRVKIEIARFDFQGKNAPLSWSMNPSQKIKIRHEWNQSLNQSNENFHKVHCFFAPTHNTCPEKLPAKSRSLTGEVPDNRPHDG